MFIFSFLLIPEPLYYNFCISEFWSVDQSVLVYSILCSSRPATSCFNSNHVLASSCTCHTFVPVSRRWGKRQRQMQTETGKHWKRSEMKDINSRNYYSYFYLSIVSVFCFLFYFYNNEQNKVNENWTGADSCYQVVTR